MQFSKSDIVIPNFSLKGKVAVITGATSGLGYGIAHTFAAYGADVVVNSRTPEACDRVAKELEEYGVRSCAIPGDMTKVADCDMLIEKAVEKMGKIDIMVCNAGNATTTRALELTEEEWDFVNDLDIKGVFFSARAAGRQMIAQGNGGRVICIASAAAMGGNIGIAHYGAAKAAVVNMAKALAAEWGRYNITVNSVCPGYVPTNINEDALSNPKVKEKIENHALIRRLGTIDEIAAPVLWLASDHAGYVTGSLVLVDGGGAAV